MKRKLLKTTSHVNASIGLLVLRIGMGAMMLTHGYPKLINILDGNMQFGDPIGWGAEISLILTMFAEFLCAILVILGLYTRIAVLPLIITMATAAFIVHGADPLATQEKALLYLIAFTALLITGGGKYSVDSLNKL